ncbi:MAG: nucleotidyltransferase domain-containing protein [Dehalococcoidia bacterium]
MSARNSADIVTQIVNKLVSNYGPQQVFIFGSYAGGHPDDDSDIDLLIIKDTPEPFFDRLTKVRQAVSGTHRAIPFDPIVLTPGELEERLKAGDQFIAGILKHGRLLYDR